MGPAIHFMTILLLFNSVLCIESRKGEGGALLAFAADLDFSFLLFMALTVGTVESHI